MLLKEKWRIQILCIISTLILHVLHYLGGTGYEPGGPGMTYFHGNHVRNLRLDNKCQRPRVTEPASTSANQAQFESYKRNGNAAFIGHYLVNYILYL